MSLTEYMFNMKKLREKKNDMILFLEKYFFSYSFEDMNQITYFLATENLLDGELDFSLLQLLSKFGIIKPEIDPYLKTAQYLQELHFLNGNCCEVGAGIYPRLSKLILPILQEHQKHLTIYEPLIMYNQMPNTTIFKEEFTLNSPINQIDTIIGLFPCEASISMIEKAMKENKNLFLAFCTCDHSSKDLPKWLGKYWAEDVCMEYKEKYGKEIQIINWPKEYVSKTPIMIRKKIIDD